MKKIIQGVILGSFLVLAADQLPVAEAAATTSEWHYPRAAHEDHFGAEILKEASYDEDALESIYRFRAGKLIEVNTDEPIASSDKAIWDIFISIAGTEFAAKHVLYFATYEDASDPTLGFVSKADSRARGWTLVANANAANPKSKEWRREMTIVMLHEYAHTLTLNPKHIDEDKKAAILCAKLKTFHVPRYGCTRPKSYLNSFVTDFWSAKDIASASRAYSKGRPNGLYPKRPTNFVTEYAATSPIEDIAESFTDFVLSAKPKGGTVKEEKILFFYKYPELVELRTKIRKAIAKDFI